MAVKDLHEAAAVLKAAHEAIASLLAETEPMEREYQALRGRGPLEDAELVELLERTGYGPYFDAAADLVGLLETIEYRERERENALARFRAS